MKKYIFVIKINKNNFIEYSLGFEFYALKKYCTSRY